MKDATERLREQGWMVAPLTQPLIPMELIEEAAAESKTRRDKSRPDSA